MLGQSLPAFCFQPYTVIHAGQSQKGNEKHILFNFQGIFFSFLSFFYFYFLFFGHPTAYGIAGPGIRLEPQLQPTLQL